MSKHTPGPWLIWKERAMQEEGLDASEINEELLEFDYFEVMSGKPIGDVSRGRIKGCTMVVELDADQFGEDEEEGRQIALSNARLIAAAPEMLEALRHIEGVAMADEPRDLPGIVQTARAAIAKATGELFNVRGEA